MSLTWQLSSKMTRPCCEGPFILSRAGVSCSRPKEFSPKSRTMMQRLQQTQIAGRSKTSAPSVQGRRVYAVGP